MRIQELPALAVSALMLCSCGTTSVDMTTTSSIHAYAAAPKGLEALVAKNSHLIEAAYTEQTHRVDTDCFPPKLKAVLADLNRRYGVKPVVTSGNRPRAKGSMHSKCLAADIRVPGVQPSKVASDARKIAGIGGVGTYCRKGIVHVDVGPRRDWRHC